MPVLPAPRARACSSSHARRPSQAGTSRGRFEPSRRACASNPQVTNVRRTHTSKDGRSVLVEFDLRGDAATAADRVQPVLATVSALQRQAPAFTVAEFGSASVNHQAGDQMNKDLSKAEQLSLPITFAIEDLHRARDRVDARGGGCRHRVVDGVGYLLKDRIMDVDEFVDAVKRVADRGTALDAEVVAQLFSHRRARGPLERLTPRELEVLGLMAEGRSNAAIASTLVLSVGAVEKNVAAIFTKLELPQTATDHRRVLAVLTYLQQD